LARLPAESALSKERRRNAHANAKTFLELYKKWPEVPPMQQTMQTDAGATPSE